MSGVSNLHRHDWDTVGVSDSIPESEVHSNFQHPCFMLLKRLLSSPPFTVTLTCTTVHHEFRFLFMFNLKSVSVCAHLFNTEYMNKLHFCSVSTTKLWTHECILHHKGCLYFAVTEKASESQLYLEITGRVRLLLLQVCQRQQKTGQLGAFFYHNLRLLTVISGR